MRTVTSHIATLITPTLTNRGVAFTTIEVRGTYYLYNGIYLRKPILLSFKKKNKSKKEQVPEMYECKNCQSISNDSELRLYI